MRAFRKTLQKHQYSQGKSRRQVPAVTCSVRMSWPAMDAFPRVGQMSPERMPSVVLFPGESVHATRTTARSASIAAALDTNKRFFSRQRCKKTSRLFSRGNINTCNTPTSQKIFASWTLIAELTQTTNASNARYCRPAFPDLSCFRALDDHFVNTCGFVACVHLRLLACTVNSEESEAVAPRHGKAEPLHGHLGSLWKT